MKASEDGYLSGAKLLVRDVRIAALLAREGRNRAVAHVFGVGSADAGLATLIAVATLAHAMHGKVRDIITAPGAPSAGDTLIGAGLLKEVVHVIAGEWSREEAVIPALVLAAVIAHHLRPWERVALHDVRAVSHRMRVDFDRRYGHLIRPNRPRPVAATGANGKPDQFRGGQPRVDLQP